jgi:probable HAF family extracellular repeat protein
LAGSTYRQIKPPQASNSFVYGISTSGELAGHVVSISQGNVNFLFERGRYRPIPILNAPSAVVYGINPAGTALVGYYQPVFGTSVGFLYQSKTTQTLQFPGAVDTAATGINVTGEVVGLFYDSVGAAHGFTWAPGGAAKK